MSYDVYEADQSTGSTPLVDQANQMLTDLREGLDKSQLDLRESWTDVDPLTGESRQCFLYDTPAAMAMHGRSPHILFQLTPRSTRIEVGLFERVEAPAFYRSSKVPLSQWPQIPTWLFTPQLGLYSIGDPAKDGFFVSGPTNMNDMSAPTERVPFLPQNDVNELVRAITGQASAAN